MMRMTRLTAACCSVALSVLMLGACDMRTPSQVKTGQIQIKEQMKTVVLSAGNISASEVNVISDDYARNGRGDMRMVVTYLDGSPVNEVQAKTQARNYSNAFAARGVRGIKIDYVPVADKTQKGQAILSYMAQVALPPEDCGRLTGYQGADSVEAVAKYDFGCETKSAMSKMIATPEDLMGRSGAPDDDARRQGTMVEKYKAGTPNEKLDGMNASEVAAGSGGG